MAKMFSKMAVANDLHIYDGVCKKLEQAGIASGQGRTAK